jgi:transglutaminase-like putative cysteine protease
MNIQLQISARHLTRYRYHGPVFCEPLLVRLRPREDAAQRLLGYSLTIAPDPAGLSQQIDLEGNVVSEAWFNGVTDSLVIVAEWQVETRCTNPFDFLLNPAAGRLPYGPRVCQSPFWALYATPQCPSGRVVELAERIARQSEHEPVEYLCRLASEICRDHEKTVRQAGPPWSPEVTLSQGKGSCRDLALVFIEASRTMGIPARFVSGYAVSHEPAVDQHLHAWGEAYLPGAGWRGFDPMSGLVVSDQHVAVAASRTPAGAAPTAGHFRSNSAASTLEVEVQVQAGALQEC